MPRYITSASSTTSNKRSLNSSIITTVLVRVGRIPASISPPLSARSNAVYLSREGWFGFEFRAPSCNFGLVKIDQCGAPLGPKCFSVAVLETYATSPAAEK